MKSKSVRRALPRRPPATASVRGAATAPSGERGQRVLAMDEVFPPHDFGPWPEGFSTSREQLYGDEGRWSSLFSRPRRAPVADFHGRLGATRWQ